MRRWTIGPVIEDGFFYDFAYKRPFTPEDLAAIEAKMTELSKADLKVSRRVMPRDDAVAYFKSLGEVYKAEIIASIPATEEIGLYGQGRLGRCAAARTCRLPASSKPFKLTKVAGAYWRGDSRNEMLQRIYGTAWGRQEQLDEYLHGSKKRRSATIAASAASSICFTCRKKRRVPCSGIRTAGSFSRRSSRTCASATARPVFGEVNGPELMDVSLWQQSGHLEKFGENMFLTKTPDERVYAIKPMNCPGHVQIFKQGIRSHRDLPIRFGEFGKVHRYEPSGALHGLMRVRAFTQDDAHIFITEEQIKEESVHNIQLLLSITRTSGSTTCA